MAANAGRVTASMDDGRWKERAGVQAATYAFLGPPLVTRIHLVRCFAGMLNWQFLTRTHKTHPLWKGLLIATSSSLQ